MFQDNALMHGKSGRYTAMVFYSQVNLMPSAQYKMQNLGCKLYNMKNKCQELIHFADKSKKIYVEQR
jgi:hypothetical protein